MINTSDSGSSLGGNELVKIYGLLGTKLTVGDGRTAILFPPHSPGPCPGRLLLLQPAAWLGALLILFTYSCISFCCEAIQKSKDIMHCLKIFLVHNLKCVHA